MVEQRSRGPQLSRREEGGLVPWTGYGRPPFGAAEEITAEARPRPPRRSWVREVAARVVLLDGWRRAALSFVAGALATLALAPYDFPAVGFLSFTLLVWLLDGAAAEPGRSLPRRLLPAFRIGWMFGFGYFVAGLWWLGSAMLVDADMFFWAIPIAVLILPAVVAIYFGLAAALSRALWSDGPGRIFALAASFALFEWLRGVLFTGFPWNEIGMMAAPVPLLMQSAAVIGADGLTLLAVFVFAAPALLADERRGWKTMGLAALLLVLHVGFGAWRLWTGDAGTVEGVRLRIVQPAIAESMKWDEAEADRTFTKLLAMTGEPFRPAAGSAEGAAEKTLIVWPESAFPFILTERPDALVKLADLLQPGETLVAGATRIERSPSGGAPRAYNAIDVIDDQGEIVGAHDKLHLVPFGEYLPFQDFLEGLGLRAIAALPGGFSPGTSRTPVAISGVPSFLPLICYEVIFPREIAGVAGKDRPGFIVNVTNDAWYGRTPGPYQHLKQAELTAVAFGLPLVRSANTGISLVADAYGRVTGGLSLGSSGVIDVGLPKAAPATLYARFKELPFWCLITIFYIVACATVLVTRARID